jgi:hypothetical protein
MRKADAHVRNVGVQHILAVFGRVFPTEHEAIRKFFSRKACRAEAVGDVLGDQAVVVALRLGSIPRLFAVGVVPILVRVRHELSKGLRRGDELFLRRKFVALVVAPKRVGQLKDPLPRSREIGHIWRRPRGVGRCFRGGSPRSRRLRKRLSRH